MKHSTPWKGMDKKEAQDHKLLEISALLEDYLEHHLDVIKVADHVIDMGPEGGIGGGQIVAQGTPESVASEKDSATGKFLAQMLA